MVDGQQRSTTIYQYYLNNISHNQGNFNKDIIQKSFLEFPLNVTELFDVSHNDSLEQFYTLVNKSGYHLNPNELNKAQYHDSLFLNLVEKIVETQELKELDIFLVILQKNE